MIHGGSALHSAFLCLFISYLIFIYIYGYIFLRLYRVESILTFPDASGWSTLFKISACFVVELCQCL